MLVVDGILYAANLGDSKAIFCRPNPSISSTCITSSTATSDCTEQQPRQGSMDHSSENGGDGNSELKIGDRSNGGAEAEATGEKDGASNGKPYMCIRLTKVCR